MRGLERAPDGPGQSSASAFTGERTLWHGFDRYDFLVDEEPLAVRPIKAAEDEACETNQHVNQFHAYAWAIANPDKVACIYGETPVLRSALAETQPLDTLAPLAAAGVPLLHVCGSLDPWLEANTRVAEARYRALGGEITVIVKEGVGHYPLAPADPHPVVDFIRRATGADGNCRA